MSTTDTPHADTYALPQEFVDFRDMIRQVVDERVRPRAAEIDAKAEYPWDLRKLFAEQDLLGLPFSTEHGGTGTGTLMLNIAIEEVAKACASSALILMLQELGTLPITLFGTAEQKDALAAQVRLGRVGAGVRVVRARGRFRPGRDAHRRGTGRRRVGDQRREELDLQRGDRRLLRGVRGHGPRGEAQHRVHRREGPRGLLRAQARAQARDQGVADGHAGLPGRARSRRQPDRGRGQGPERRARHAGPLAPRRGGPGRRDRPGRDRLRQRVRQGAHGVRQADQPAPGDPVQARRHADAHRGGPRAALQGLRDGGPRRPRTEHVHLDGQAVLRGHGDVGHGGGDPGARGLRIRRPSTRWSA